MRITNVLTASLLACVVTSGARAQGSPDPRAVLETLRTDIQAGWLASDAPRLSAAIKLADRATVLYPKEALLYYYLGLASYRMVELVPEESKRALLTQGLDALATANKLSPSADAYILRWALMGQTITDAGSAMAVVAPMQQELAQATRLGKDNPRVWLVNGVGTFFTPAMWGGGADAALTHLKKAEALFKADLPAKGMPDWGRAESYAWLGVVHQKLGHTEESRHAYQEALRLEPGFIWVRDRLLPGLEKGIQPFP